MRRSVGTLAAIGGGAVLVAAALLSTRAGVLDAAWAGCVVVDRFGTCELTDTLQSDLGAHVLRVWVDLDRGAELTAHAGWARLPLQELTDATTTDGRLFEVKVPSGDHRVILVARGGGRIRWASRRVRDWSVPDWLIDANCDYEADKNPDAAATLASHAKDVLSPLVAAQVASLQVSLDQDSTDEKVDAVASAEKALRLSREAGSPSLVAGNAVRLGAMQVHEAGDLEKAEALHSEVRRSDESAPLVGWIDLQRASFLFNRGDVRGALECLDPEPLWIRRLRLPWQVAELRLSRADLYRALGRLQAAEQQLSMIQDASLSPCRRANLQAVRGSLRIEQLQVALARTGRVDPSIDWRTPLLAALEGHRQCRQPKHVAEDEVELARAYLLVGDINGARSSLDAALAADRDAEGRTGIGPEVTELRGRLALAEKQPEAAERIFRELLADPTERAFDLRWRALVGLAEVIAARDPAGALKQLRDSQLLLDEIGPRVPVELGQGSFYGMRERGDALQLRLLLADKKPESHLEAFELYRYARVRALIELREVARSASLDDRARAAEQRDWKAYREQRSLVIKAQAKMAGAAEGDRPRLREELASLETKKAALFQKLADRNPLLRHAWSFRAPAAGEVLLGMHPVEGGWLLLARDPAGVRSMQVSDEVVRAEGAALGAAITSLAGAARQLTILPYGRLRRADIGALPAGDQTIAARYQLQYSIDLPFEDRAASRAASRSAFVLVDPTGGVSGGRQTGVDLKARYQAQGLATSVEVAGTVADFGPSGQPQGKGSEERTSGLEGILQFVFIGHGEQGVLVSTEDLVGLDSAEILRLRPAPERVHLLACETGDSDEEVGGLESAGLPAAFLLAGSRYVIAPIRKIRPAVGERLALELAAAQAGHHSDSNENSHADDPAAILAEAIASVRRGPPPADVSADDLTRDLDAFRVFVR